MRSWRGVGNLSTQREFRHELPGFVEREFRAHLDCGVRAALSAFCGRIGWCRIAPNLRMDHLNIGTRLSSYEVTGPLGKGGMGETLILNWNPER